MRSQCTDRHVHGYNCKPLNLHMCLRSQGIAQYWESISMQALCEATLQSSYASWLSICHICRPWEASIRYLQAGVDLTLFRAARQVCCFGPRGVHFENARDTRLVGHEQRTGTQPRRGLHRTAAKYGVVRCLGTQQEASLPRCIDDHIETLDNNPPQEPTVWPSCIKDTTRSTYIWCGWSPDL